MADFYVDVNGKVTKKKKSSDFIVGLDGKVVKTLNTSKKQTTARNIAPMNSVSSGMDIAPVRATVNTTKKNNAPSSAASAYSGNNITKGSHKRTDIKESGDKKIKFFKEGKNFEDEYQLGDITDTIVATVADFGINAAKSASGVIEGAGDALTYGLAWIPEILGASKVADYMRHNIALPNATEDLFAPIINSVKPYSVLDRTMDATAQGMGQMGLLIGTGGALGALGVPSAAAGNMTLGMLGASSVGHGTTEAYSIEKETGKEITDAQAFSFGLGQGAIDTATEMLFGGIGRGVNALGFNRGISSLDDAFAFKLSSMMKNQLAKNGVEFSVKAMAEGSEEVIAGYGSALLKNLTIMKDEDLEKLIEDENLLEQFVSATLSTVALQSGYIPGTKNGSFREANEQGKDYITGFTQEEQKVIDRVYEDAVKKEESNGKKVANKEKKKIHDEVVENLKKGYIDTDTIESVLGGETYRQLKSVEENETNLQKEYDALKEEYDTLNKMKHMEMTGEQTDRKEELKKELEKLKENLKNSKENSNRTQLRSQLDSEILEIVKGTKLSESYNEKARRKQGLEVDVESYKNESAKKTAQNFKDFGVNNTNAAHDFLDLVTKVAEDRDHTFKFMTTKQLEEAKNKGDYKIEGDVSKVEAFVSGATKEIIINMDVNKSLSSLVGHEITHTLEGDTVSYEALKKPLFELAKTRGEFDARWKSIQERYSKEKGYTEEEQYRELTADLVGDYIFGDSDFIANLSKENPNVFKKIYNEIKYLWKMATAGSKEKRQLETAKKKFEDAWRENLQAANFELTVENNNETVYNDIEYSLYEQIIRKHYDTKQTEFWVNDYNAYYKVIIDKDLSYNILKKMDIDGNEDYIKELIKETKNADTYRKNISSSNANTKSVAGIDDWDNVATQGEQGWSEFISEILAKIESEGADRDNNSIQSGGNSQGNQYSLSRKTSSEDGVFFDAPIKDIKYSFAGENALTANKSSLENAKSMNAKGMSSEDIRLATGWHKGYDGKWRFEIDDSQMEIRDIESNYMKLDQLLKHDKLFEAYPILRELGVVFQDIEGNGSFNTLLFDIYLNSRLKTDPEQLRKTLIHEIQHVIQSEEGFANGANIEYWSRKLENGYDSRPSSVKIEEWELRKQYLELQETDPEFIKDMETLKKMTPNVPRGEINWETFEEIEEDPIEWQEYDAERERLEEKYGEERVWDFQNLEYQMDKLKSKKRTAEELYYDTAGEIESRETSRRLTFNENERKRYQPRNKHENLNRDNVVFANKNNRFRLADDIPTKEYGNHIYSKDVALDEAVQPTTTVDELSIRRGYAPLTAEEAEERDVARRGEVAPAQQTVTEPKTVAERVEVQRKAVQTELDNNIQNRSDSYEAFTEKIENLQAKYDSKKNKETKAANDILRSIERAKRLRDSIDADYSKRISDLEKKVEKMKSPEYATAMQRQEKQRQLANWASDLIGDTSTWVDKKLGVQYKTNTLRRNLRDVVRDAEGKRDIAKADAIYDELQGKYNHNEAELKRESARIKKMYADMKITKAEDAYIQMLGELRHNPDTKLKKEDVEKFYEKNKEHIDTEKVDRAIAEARKTYDDLIKRVNMVLKEQGMKEIPYRKGYFPHFMEDKQGFLAKLLNWKTINTEIPTDIAGMTEMFKPNRSWQSFNKRRTSDDTDYSFMKGLDTYIHGSLDWIYHIEDIQKRRAFENQIRYVHSEQGIKDKIEAIQNNEEYDAEEAQKQIDLVYKEAGNPLQNFVKDLNAGTNTLANKKSSLDRTMEDLANRKVYSTMTNLSNRVAANQVAGSISSALTNFIPITQSWMQVSPVRSLQAMRDTIRSAYKDDGTIEKSDFLTNRFRSEENLYRTTWDTISDKATFIMNTIDSFSSQIVWRSKYIDNISNGMSENAAIKNADQFAENVIAGRSRGNMPTIFDSKNPLIKTLTVFQLEVANQYGYMFKDAPQDVKTEGTAKLMKGYATMFFGAYAYNALYSLLTGRKTAFDPIRIIEELLRDIGILGEDEEEPEETIINLTDNILKETPFVGGLIGGGRIPISSAFPYGDNIYDAFKGTIEDISDKDLKSLTKEWLNPIYYLAMPLGGGQLRKTVQGLSMFSNKHPIAGSYTDSGALRFPIEDTLGNKIKAGIFGQWSSENARDYLENQRSPLQEKQIKEFMEVDLPIRDYWEYREGLSGLKTLSDKADYINSLDLPIAKKNILVNNQSDRKEPIDLTGFDDRYENFEEFDFAIKNPEKYKIALEVGGYKKYMEYKKGMEGLTKLTEKGDYIASLNIPVEHKNALINGEADRKTPIDMSGFTSKYKNFEEFDFATRYPDKYKVLQSQGITVNEYKNKYEESAFIYTDDYSWAADNPEKYNISKIISDDVKVYKKYTKEIGAIKGDDAKKRKKEYIFGLNLDYGQQAILYRSLFNSKQDKNTYNYDIVEYLNNRSDVSYVEMVSILEELEMTVHSDGTVTW